ncbi:MAG TPA: hypothetical protein VF545_03195 [Thermoleophilaceae bacterium]
MPGGTDVLHVPMAWCVVNGSPAQAAPNITSEGSGVTDTNTDAVIWRRHERPTDNIFLPQATISLRSAINNAMGAFNFPHLDDTDTTNGQAGDVNGWNVNVDSTEFRDLITDCDEAYTALGRAGVGVTAVNVNLFHDNANPAAPDGNTQFDYVAIGGWGGCAENSTGNCATPYDGRIMVVDNHYLYPTVVDRTWPPSPADPMGNRRFAVTDPFDQVSGHEIGHALSLEHRANDAALMRSSSFDSNGDGRIDNIGLNATEVTALRSNAANVPGLETDPPGDFVPGRVLSMRLVDGNRNKRLRPYRDIASVTVALDRRRNELHIAQQLGGLLPCSRRSVTRYGFLADLDNNTTTGARKDALLERGLPSAFRGADFVGRATVIGGVRRLRSRTCRVIGSAWIATRGVLKAISSKRFDVEIQTLRMHPHFIPVEGVKPPRDFVAEVYNTIAFTVRNRGLPTAVRPRVPFRVQTPLIARGKAVDAIRRSDRGATFELESPPFPHCFPAGDAAAGQAVDVAFDGLRPNAGVHALLGPEEVARGKTDASGAGSVRVPIPKGTRPGLHLVTIGHDGLALTADCSVNVKG